MSDIMKYILTSKDDAFESTEGLSKGDIVANKMIKMASKHANMLEEISRTLKADNVEMHELRAELLANGSTCSREKLELILSLIDRIDKASNELFGMYEEGVNE